MHNGGIVSNQHDGGNGQFLPILGSAGYFSKNFSDITFGRLGELTLRLPLRVLRGLVELDAPHHGVVLDHHVAALAPVLLGDNRDLGVKPHLGRRPLTAAKRREMRLRRGRNLVGLLCPLDARPSLILNSPFSILNSPFSSLERAGSPFY